MPPTMRSAAKAAKEAIKANQEPNPGDDAIFGDDDTKAIASIDQSKVAKTPSKAMPASVTKSAKKRKAIDTAWPWTHQRPTPEEVAENTRASGRNLVPWQRARMAEKFLLNMEYECSRQGIAVPWDDIAHRFHPGATAAGVQQHFARLRSILAAEGHLIPPKIPTKKDKKDRAPVDSTIRGYLRQKVDKNGAIIVRSVKYTEPLEHPTFNRADAHDIRAYEDNEDDSQPHKARKLESGDGAQPGSASKATKTRRRTRVPITYQDAAESDPNDDQEADEDCDEEVMRAGNNELEGDVAINNFPIGDDVDVEELAMALYTRTPNPRVISNDPNPVYCVHGQPMTYTQVCARAVEFHQLSGGYHDPECARIINNHAYNGQPPALGPFGVNNFNHPIPQYGNSYQPLGTSFADNQGLGTNNVNTGYEQSVPVTPTGHAQATLGGLFGSHGNAAANMGSGPGIKFDYNSPPAYNPGGRMSGPNDYKTPAKTKAGVDFTTPTKCKSVLDTAYDSNNDLPRDMFSDYKVNMNSHKLPGVSAGMTTGNNPGFNTTAYARHMEADHSKVYTGSSSADAATADNIGDLFNNPFGRNLSATYASNIGSVAGPSSSASNNDIASPQDTATAGYSSSALAPSPAPVAGDLDERFDPFTLMSNFDDESDKA